MKTDKNAAKMTCLMPNTYAIKEEVKENTK
jgi:hypothetical protein